MRRTRPVRGQVIAVTGAANGIGENLARSLAELGARVVLGDLDGPACTAVASSIGGSALGLALDVTDPRSFGAFLDAAEQGHGRIDVLVNNAGVMKVGPYDRESERETTRQIEVNLLGAIRGVKLAGPRMARRGHGHIVTIASAASTLAPPGEATYAASKHGIYGYLKAVRAELRGSGVQLSVIMPGVVDTALAAGTRTGAVGRLSPDAVTRAVVRTIERPRFQTHVPHRIGLLDALVGVLPQRGRDLLLRVVLPDQVAAVRGNATRAGYESALLGSPGADGEA